MTSVGCYDVNPELVGNHSCTLKPTRDGNGITTFWVSNIRKTNDFWLNIQIHYKYRTVFRLWQVNWDIDICKFMDNAFSTHSFFKTFANEIIRQSNFLHKCPYEGPTGTVNINWASIFENVIPQVLPRGTYKAVFRYYRSKDNATMIVCWGTAEISAVDVIKNYDMGK